MSVMERRSRHHETSELFTEAERHARDAPNDEAISINFRLVIRVREFSSEYI